MSSCNWAARNSWRATATASPATSWYVIRRPAPIAIPRPSPVWPSASNFPSRARSLLTASPVARRPSFRALTRLGFRIIRIGEDWSEEEVLATVEDYFDMLRAEAAGEPYNKSEHNQALRQLLNGRSKSSVELKHQNISAVLDALGLPYINGYKPRGNSQLLLRKSVHAYVLEHQQTVGALVDALEEVKLPGDKTYRAAFGRTTRP